MSLSIEPVWFMNIINTINAMHLKAFITAIFHHPKPNE
jgi:hypothetical protein